MRLLILFLLAVTALSFSFSVWLYVSAVRGEPEWSRSMIGPPVAVSMIATCVATVLMAIRGQQQMPYRLPLTVMAAGILCVLVQTIADWRSSQPVTGGAIGGDPGDRFTCTATASGSGASPSRSTRGTMPRTGGKLPRSRSCSRAWGWPRPCRRGS